MSRLRHALRDVTEVEEGHPSAAAKPAFRPNTGSMPVAHVAPLRKATAGGEPAALSRGNVDSLSAATVAKLSDDELVAAFGLTPDEVHALRTRLGAGSSAMEQVDANEAAPRMPPSTPAAAPPIVAAPELVFPPFAAAVNGVATVHAVEDAAPSKVAAPPAPASKPSPARNALFGDDDDDEDSIFAPVAKPRAPAAAAPAPPAPAAAAIFGDEEEEEEPLFRAAPAAQPKAAVPSAVKKSLFDDDDDDDSSVFARPAAAPAQPAAPPPTAAAVASKPLFEDDDDDDVEIAPSKAVVKDEAVHDDPLFSKQPAAPQPVPPVVAPPPAAVKPPVRAKSLFDDDDDDSPLGVGRSKPSGVPPQPAAAPLPQPSRRGILDIGSAIGATDEDAVDDARAQESSEIVKAQMAAHLDELHAAAEDAAREAEHFQVTFSALEQKLASLESKAVGTRAEAVDGDAANAPPSGLLFADDAQDESVLRAESRLSTLNMLTKPAGDAPAAAAAVGQALFDDLPPLPPKAEQLSVADPAAVPSPAKRSVLFDDSDDEELPVEPPPAVPAAADVEPEQPALPACEDEVAPPEQAEPAVELPEPPQPPAALFDDEASEQVLASPEPEAAADPVDVEPPPAPAALLEHPPLETFHEVAIANEDAAAPAADGEGPPAAAAAEAPPAASPAPPVAESQPVAALAAPVRAPVPGGRVAAIAAAFASAGEAPPAKPATARVPAASAPSKQSLSGAPAPLPAASPVTVESVAVGSAGEVKRPAPPARGPRRLISAPQPSSG